MESIASGNIREARKPGHGNKISLESLAQILAVDGDLHLGVLRVELELHALHPVLQLLRRDDLRGRRPAHRLPIVTQAHLDAVRVRVGARDGLGLGSGSG